MSRSPDKWPFALVSGRFWRRIAEGLGRRHVSGNPDGVPDLLDDVLLRVLQDALSTVARVLTGIADATPTTEEQLEAMSIIRDGADRALRSLVTDARYEGMTWDAIGRSIGVTRQSAHQRYSHADDHWFWLG